MDAPCNVFLACARLAADKDCRVRGGDLAYEFAHVTHFTRVADEFARDAFDDVANFFALDLVLDFDGFEVSFQNSLNAFKKFASLANFLNFFDYGFESRVFKGFYIHFVFATSGKLYCCVRPFLGDPTQL